MGAERLGYLKFGSLESPRGTNGRVPCPTSRDCVIDMYRMRLIQGVVVLCVIVSTLSVLADGMVISQVFYPKVEIPNQQALICFSNGVERLVIETSFLGEGTNFAWVVPLPSAPDAALTFAPSSYRFGLVNTLGGSAAGVEVSETAGVSVLSIQRAGVFDATTIRGDNPSAVLEWLKKNEYQTPKSAEPAIRHYVEQGWVFVASKVRCAIADSKNTAIHPLVFTFAARKPVYPTRLTAINNGTCAIDLYVFGKQRATARHFVTVRCDSVASSLRPAPKSLRPALRIADPEVLGLIGDAPVGTKLRAHLSPGQMDSDVDIHSTWFWRSGTTVYSHSGALMIALNISLPLAALGWFLMGSSRGGWNVSEKWISRWRWRLLAGAAGIGLAVFLLLPKVEIVSLEIASHALVPQQEALALTRPRFGA